VDDGSTDGSAAILDEYAARDARIKVIHQENAGVSVARNAGLDAVTGDLVTFVDADDWLERDTYEKVVVRMTGEVELVCFGTRIESDVWGLPQSELQELLNPEKCGLVPLIPDNAMGINGCVWNKVIRMNVLRQYNLRFFEGVSYGEDVAFIYCVLGCAHFAWCEPERLYHYQLHAQSATGGAGRKSLRILTHLSSVESVYHFYCRLGLNSERRRLLSGLFEHSYFYVCRSIDVRWRAAADAEARRVAETTGLLSCWENGAIRCLLSNSQSRISGLFRWFRANCVSFGVLGRGLWSITYEPGKRVYRLMGMAVWTAYVNEVGKIVGHKCLIW
jgi:glycosyltransferase involved in cell wall biosynthesis